MQGSRTLFGRHFLTRGAERSHIPYGVYRIAQSGMHVRRGHDGPFPSQTLTKGVNYDKETCNDHGQRAGHASRGAPGRSRQSPGTHRRHSDPQTRLLRGAAVAGADRQR